MCQCADRLTAESAKVSADSITVISRAAGSSLMRFHATTETAEGQRYDALQRGGGGVPQQPVVPLLLYLPPHKTCARALSAARPGIACWHCQSADVRRRVTARPLSPRIRCETCFPCETSNLKNTSIPPAPPPPLLCSQRTGACHTINHLSPPPAATAHPAQPPPRARRDRARPRVPGSRSSGPSRSMRTSWGPTDRDSTQASYVSEAAFFFTRHRRRLTAQDER